MKALYLAIKERIESLAPAVKFIHVFNNQFELTENGQIYSFPFPCVFIEFQNDQPVQQLGNGIQIYQPLIIRVHIGHNQYDAADGTMEQDLNVFDLKQQVFSALQKFEPAGAVMFIRTNETQDTNHTNIYHFIQEYTTSYVDQQQAEPVGGITADPPFELDLTMKYDPAPYLNEIETTDYILATEDEMGITTESGELISI